MAILSSVKIANMALANIGAKSTIESFNESSTEALICSLWYDHSRKEALEAYDWSFARKRIALAKHGDEPPAEWAFRYQYPSDCVKARRIPHEGLLYVDRNESYLYTPNTVPFIVELSEDGDNKSILTDMGGAKLVYTKDVTNVMLYSAAFVTALSYKLAHNIAFSLTGKMSIKEVMLGIFAQEVRAAAAQDFNEGMDRPREDASWIKARS